MSSGQAVPSRSTGFVQVQVFLKLTLRGHLDSSMYSVRVDQVVVTSDVVDGPHWFSTAVLFLGCTTSSGQSRRRPIDA